jgi:hypothetical protein
MDMAAMIPKLGDAELLSLQANAVRLQAAGGKNQDAAAELLPLIAAELAGRKVKAPRKAPVRKKKVAEAEVEG